MAEVEAPGRQQVADDDAHQPDIVDPALPGGKPGEVIDPEEPAEEDQGIAAGSAGNQAQMPNNAGNRGRRTWGEWAEIDDAIKDHYSITRMSPHGEECARNFVVELEGYLNDDNSGIKQYFRSKNADQPQLFSEVTLTIIGSLGSGIATKHSDVNICVRFMDSPKASEDLDNLVRKAIRAVIEERVTDDIEERTVDARGTVLQFSVFRDNCQLTVDVSYNDMPSLYSSSLIRAYCEWEPRRLPMLILWAKKWAQICGISAKDGQRLSPYAYTVMLIHFLQQCVPRVLPRLQHEFASRDNPVEMKSFGYFHKGVLPHWSKNVRTVGRLWVEFLEYFNRYNNKNRMISMRTKYTTPNSTSFTGKFMTIEDPFRGDHNIAKNIGHHVLEDILESFKRSKEIFSTQDIRDALWPIVNGRNFARCLGVVLLNACYGAVLQNRQKRNGRNAANAVLRFDANGQPYHVAANRAEHPPPRLDDVNHFPDLDN